MATRGQQNQQTQDKLTRIAIVSTDKCKPKRCRQECKKSCPVVRMGTYKNRVLKSPSFSVFEFSFCAMWIYLLLTGKLCIEVTPESKVATISEPLCIGCGICAKVNRFLSHYK